MKNLIFRIGFLFFAILISCSKEKYSELPVGNYYFISDNNSYGEIHITTDGNFSLHSESVYDLGYIKYSKPYLVKNKDTVGTYTNTPYKFLLYPNDDTMTLTSIDSLLTISDDGNAESVHSNFLFRKRLFSLKKEYDIYVDDTVNLKRRRN